MFGNACDREIWVLSSVLFSRSSLPIVKLTITHCIGQEYLYYLFFGLFNYKTILSINLTTDLEALSVTYTAQLITT